MTRKTLLLILVAGCLIVTLGWLQETKADDIQSLLANPTPEVTGTVGDLHNQLLARGPFRGRARGRARRRASRDDADILQKPTSEARQHQASRKTDTRARYYYCTRQEPGTSMECTRRVATHGGAFRYHVSWHLQRIQRC